MLKGRSLLEPLDFSTEELEWLFDIAEDIIDAPDKYSNICNGKLLATLFYEPSTRTRFSFEAAMLRLGGQVIGFSEPNSSAVAKGESIADTVNTVACYVDLTVMRHPKEGAPRVAAKSTGMPIINAGDGGHQHPTQTLTDLLTIRRRRGQLGNMKIGLCGDLKFGRTVHSLIKALLRYDNIEFVLISPEELRVPSYIREEVLEKSNASFKEVTDLVEAMPDLDALYMTRVQKERFFNEEDYVRLKDSYILDNEKMQYANDSMMVLHPLPRVNEISPEVDDDPRAIYFEQAKNGMFVRMALIMALLGLKNLDDSSKQESGNKPPKNPTQPEKQNDLNTTKEVTA